jgi:hypothetical protein
VDRFCLDVVNSDQVTGWCLDPSARIAVAVEGRPVGLATFHLPRPDVALKMPHEPHAATSGFTYNFGPDDIARLHRRRATVEVHLSGTDWEERRAVPVAWLEPSDQPVAQGPFPVPLLKLLVSLDASFASPAWSDEQMLEAAKAIEFLARHGSKTLPGLSRYLSWVILFWMRTQYAELNFPRVNYARQPSDKDASPVQSSGFEMLAIAHHLRVLESHGVQGDMLEFGCFKGFSTAMLSVAQHELGRHLHVFDSFAGLPPSDAEYYQAGDFAGGLDEVRRNVGEFGQLDAVTFHKGFFADSLPTWPRVPIACLWMDVDLESSARDALQVFETLDSRGALFSHECGVHHFIGREVRSEPSPTDVVVPIIDAFRAAGRPLEGRFVAGNTGAFWSPDTAPPVLTPTALAYIRDVAKSLA